MLKEFKDTWLFLIKYVLIYVGLNTIYAFYVDYHHPDPDPLTIMVTDHAVFFLSLLDADISYVVVPGETDVPVKKLEQTVIEVYEGCNSVNVMVVFVAFLVSFQGPLKSTVKFIVSGLIVIYMVNLFRVMALYAVGLYIPDSLYFFHKFFFTGIIYLVVFIFWYYWIRRVKECKTSHPA